MDADSDCPDYPPKHPFPEEDEGTLYRDDESYISDGESSFTSEDSWTFNAPPPRNWNRRLPEFRLDREDGQKEVFECWKLFVVPDREEAVSGVKILGINTVQEWDRHKGTVITRAQIKDQSTLTEMYQNVMAKHAAKNRRSWASRIVRGKGESYEQDLEKRCRKLARPLQDTIRDLLIDRGNASSTLYHERTWNVVYMQERWVHRFTRPQGAEVKRHKLRFWKNPKSQQLTECFIIIRGAETGTPDSKAGYAEPHTTSNPWYDVDLAETTRILRAEDRARRLERIKRRNRSASRPRARPRHRRANFDAPLPRQSRRRDRSCDSLDDPYYHYRYDPPSPDFIPRRKFFGPIPACNPAGPTWFPPAPTPPQSFPPPPGVAAFHAGMMAPPPPPPFPNTRPRNPFHSVRPMASDWSSAPPFPGYCHAPPPPPPPPAEFPGSGMDMDSSWTPIPPPPPETPVPAPAPPFRPKSRCAACINTPACVHFSGPGTECFRPIYYSDEVVDDHTTCSMPRHPQCLFCADPVGAAPPPFEYDCGMNPFAPRLQTGQFVLSECGPGVEGVDEEEDNTTVLDEDEDDEGDVGEKGEDLKSQDGEDTKIEGGGEVSVLNGVKKEEA